MPNMEKRPFTRAGPPELDLPLLVTPQLPGMCPQSPNTHHP